MAPPMQFRGCRFLMEKVDRNKDRITRYHGFLCKSRSELVQPVLRRSRGESICIFAFDKYRCVAAVQPAASDSPPLCRIGSVRFPCEAKKEKHPKRGAFLFGGAEGNRTPVRKQLGKNFSGCSLLFTFPQPGGNKHPTGLGSFMMHGMGKAYHTHVLHSNHTRARFVDLPGRMGA